MISNFEFTSDEEFLGFIATYLQSDDKLVSDLANLSALIFEYLNDISWCGFYLLDGNELYLGPFQGKAACTRIKIGKGVCGTAYQKEKTIIVDDVNTFPGHIACSSSSKSEIVVPLIKNERLFGVLDVDSPIKDRFGEEEANFFEKAVSLISSSFIAEYLKELCERE